MLTSPVRLCRPRRQPSGAHPRETRGSRPAAARFVRDTDCPMEEDGFEPSVPPSSIYSDVPHPFRTVQVCACRVSAYPFAVFTRRIARLRVRGARATVWGSRTGRSSRNAPRANCHLFGLASRGIVMKPAAFDYQARRLPWRSNRPARIGSRGGRHRRRTELDAGSRLSPSHPELAGRSAAAAWA